MEWIILLIFSLILLAWRINKEMSSIQPPTNPFVSKKQEDQSSFETYEDDQNRALMDDSFSDSLGTSFSLNPLDSANNYPNIYTDPSYCHLPGNIYYHICHDDNLSSSNWDDWSSNSSDDWGGSSWDSWSGSSNWDS